VHVGSYLLWAFVATLVLSGGMYAAQEAGLSRMSIPFPPPPAGSSRRASWRSTTAAGPRSSRS